MVPLGLSGSLALAIVAVYPDGLAMPLVTIAFYPHGKNPQIEFYAFISLPMNPR